MDAVNLRGPNMTNRKRHFGRDLRPETLTTNGKWTGVRDPRADVRFSLEDRVIWDQGNGNVFIAVIDAFVDDCTARVRFENGRTAIWPTFSPRMRRIVPPDFEDSTSFDMDDSALTSVEELPCETDYYENVTLTTSNSARKTIPDFVEYASTLPGTVEGEEE
jgi:hypothetical protein